MHEKFLPSRGRPGEFASSGKSLCPVPPAATSCPVNREISGEVSK